MSGGLWWFCYVVSGLLFIGGMCYGFLVICVGGVEYCLCVGWGICFSMFCIVCYFWGIFGVVFVVYGALVS